MNWGILHGLLDGHMAIQSGYLAGVWSSSWVSELYILIQLR